MAAAGSCSTSRRGASETLLGVTQTSAKMKNWVEFGFDIFWESMRSSWALDWEQQDANPSALVPQHYNALQSRGFTFQSSKRWKFPYPRQWVRTGSLCPLCPVSRSSSLVYDYNLLKEEVWWHSNSLVLHFTGQTTFVQFVYYLSHVNSVVVQHGLFRDYSFACWMRPLLVPLYLHNVPLQSKTLRAG